MIKAPTTPKGKFFCKGHLQDLPLEQRSPIDGRYCKQCYKVIDDEMALAEFRIQSLPVKGKTELKPLKLVKDGEEKPFEGTKKKRQTKQKQEVKKPRQRGIVIIRERKV